MTAVAQLEAAPLPARPFVKWVGGKRQLLTELLKRVPATWGRYHEPFVGGGALLWQLLGMWPDRPACINDAEKRLARTYRAVRANVDDVIARLLEHQDLYNQDPSTYYYAQRARDVDIGDDVEVAAWMILLNKTGFNGLYRVNAAGKMNNPHGKPANRQQKIVVCDPVNLRACSDALQRVSISGVDFSEALDSAVAGDLVYLDPPYVPVAADSFTAYTAAGFGPQDQVRLRDKANALREAGVYVILSNSGAPWVRELYEGWTIHDVKARRSINAKGTGRGPVGEVVVTP